MNDMKFECPRCKQHLEVPAELLGQTVDCPTCKGQLTLPKPVIQPQDPPAPVQSAPPPMPEQQEPAIPSTQAKTPENDDSRDAAEKYIPTPQKGINRLGFLFFFLGAIGLFFCIPASSQNLFHLIVLFFFPVYFRFKNIGYKRAWVYAIFATFPIVFLWIWGRGFYLQPNYVGELDKKGKIILPIYWVLVSILILIAAMIGMGEFMVQKIDESMMQNRVAPAATEHQRVVPPRYDTYDEWQARTRAMPSVPPTPTPQSTPVKMRTWTGRNRMSMNAKFVSRGADGVGVILRGSDGRDIHTKMYNLSNADQQYIKTMEAE